MRRKYGRNYKSFKNQIPQISIVIVFIIGIIIGSLFSNTLYNSMDSEAIEITKLVEGFIVNINLNGLSSSYLLRRSLLTYGKQVLFIWLFGLFSITMPFIGLLVAVQGFSYGFTTSFFVMQYNLKGLLLCFAAYGIQGTLFVCIMFMLSVEGIRFAKKDSGVNSKVYLIYLLVAMFCTTILSLYESYIAPILIQNTITTFF